MLAVAATALVLAMLAASTQSAVSGATTEGVSSLSYAPKPFYDDLSRMRVRFTTTGRAGPGREYDVILFILGPEALGSCDYSAPCCSSTAWSKLRSDTLRPVRVLGQPGRTYTVWLRAQRPSAI
jgi:hypothetical protein